MDPTPLLIFCALMCTGALVHALSTRGAHATARLLGLLLLFYLFKGLIDAGRQPQDFPYDMHLRMIEREGRHLGIHLILFPMLRIGFAYTAVCIAEKMTALSPGREGRYWPMVSASIFAYGVLGMAIEFVNEASGWWTWDQSESLGAFQFVHYLLTWIVWAAGVFEALFASFVAWKRFRRPWLVSIGILASFYALLLTISMIAPFLRNPIFLPFAVTMMVIGLVLRGPVLVGLRRGPTPG